MTLVLLMSLTTCISAITLCSDIFYSLFQLVNSIATTYVGTNAYMAVSISFTNSYFDITYSGIQRYFNNT